MPRDPKVVAIQKLVAIDANYRTASAGLEILRKQRTRAIVEAVKAGNSKAAVGRSVNITAARVSVLASTGEE